MNKYIQRLLTIVIFLLNLNLNAQDGHYWTEPHGTKSILLSGVVIGSVEDLGTVYYNPARLAKIENPAFLLSGKLYQLDRIKIEDGAGDGLDLNQTRFGGYPNMAAGTFKLKFLKDHFFSYSFLTRNTLKANYFIHNDDVGNIIDAWPGEETYGGQFRFQKGLKDDWFGLTWAYNLNSTWSVGITNFVSVRHQNELLATELQAYSAINELAFLHNTRSIDYTSFGLLWKISLAFEVNNLSAGLTITTPKVNLFGKGSTYYQDFYNGPDDANNNGLDKIYVSNYQDKLPAKHHSPWAIGFGAGYKIGKSKFHFSGEWYQSVSKYELMSSDPFEGQSDQKMYEVKLIDQLDAVFNAGVGYEYNVNNKYAFFGSFATDFSAVHPAVKQYIVTKETAYASMIQANMYHVGGGILLDIKWLEITAGLSHAFANQDIDRPFQFPEEEGDFAKEPEGQSKMKIGRWKFVLGFSVPFFKKNKILEYD